MYKLIIIFILSGAFLTSCRSTKNIQTAIAKKDTVAVVAPPVENLKEDSIAFIKDVQSNILKHQISFTTFSAKIDVDYTDGDDKKYNVNAHLRMYKDSVIWVSVTAILGIEGLRALITKDSVKILNKQDKIYTTHSVSYLKEVTALPLTLASLQDLLMGNPVFLDSNIISYTKVPGSISLVSLGAFFKNLFTVAAEDRLMLSSKLDDVDELRNRTCLLTYSNYENKQGVYFPSKRSISVTEKKKLDIKFDFKQYEFNETLSFPFSIPKSYKQK